MVTVGPTYGGSGSDVGWAWAHLQTPPRTIRPATPVVHSPRTTTLAPDPDPAPDPAPDVRCATGDARRAMDEQRETIRCPNTCTTPTFHKPMHRPNCRGGRLACPSDPSTHPSPHHASRTLSTNHHPSIPIPIPFPIPTCDMRRAMRDARRATCDARRATRDAR